EAARRSGRGGHEGNSPRPEAGRFILRCDALLVRAVYFNQACWRLNTRLNTLAGKENLHRVEGLAGPLDLEEMRRFRDHRVGEALVARQPFGEECRRLLALDPGVGADEAERHRRGAEPRPDRGIDVLLEDPRLELARTAQ